MSSAHKQYVTIGIDKEFTYLINHGSHVEIAVFLTKLLSSLKKMNLNIIPFIFQILNPAEFVVIGTFWTQNMTVTGSMTELKSTDDGKTLYAEVSDASSEFKSGTVSLAILGLSQM